MLFSSINQCLSHVPGRTSQAPKHIDVWVRLRRAMHDQTTVT